MSDSRRVGLELATSDAKAARLAAGVKDAAGNVDATSGASEVAAAAGAPRNGVPVDLLGVFDLAALGGGRALDVCAVFRVDMCRWSRREGGSGSADGAGAAGVVAAGGVAAGGVDGASGGVGGKERPMDSRAGASKTACACVAAARTLESLSKRSALRLVSNCPRWAAERTHE